MKVLVKISIIVGIVAVVLLITMRLNLYYLRESSSGLLLWNENEAYLFMNVTRRGVRLKVLDYPGMVVTEWLSGSTLPSDKHIFLSVIRVTPTGVQRHVGQLIEQAADMPHFFTPINQTVYAKCPGVVCKWVGDGFENATEEEQKKLGGIDHLSSDSDTTINGWSKRGIGPVTGDSQFAVEIGKGVTVRVRQGNVYKSTPTTVDLDRVGRPTQQLWHVDEQPRRVSKWEYEQALVTHLRASDKSGLAPR